MKFERTIPCLLACLALAVQLQAVCWAAGDEAPAADGISPAESRKPEGAGTDGYSAPWPLSGGAFPGGESDLPEEANDAGSTFSEKNETTEAPGRAGAGAAPALPGGTANPDSLDGHGPEAVTMGTVTVDAGTHLHLRAGPGLQHPILGNLLRGDGAEVVGETGDWYQVVVPAASGYVHKDYLDVTEQAVSALPPEAVSSGGKPGPDSNGDALSGGGDISPWQADTGPSGWGAPAGEMGGQAEAGQASLPPPSAALTPEGNLTLVDDWAQRFADGSGKQFITLVTKAGSTFYLIIDRDDKGGQNVHFLNLVDEADLLSLMDETKTAQFPFAAGAETPEETAPPPGLGAGPDRPGEQASENPAPKTNPLPALLLLLALLGGGGFYAYSRFFKGGGKGAEAMPDPDADYSEGEDEEYGLPEGDFPEGEEPDSPFDPADDALI